MRRESSFGCLNRTKGPSVRAPRAQCDKKAYQFRMKAVLERTRWLGHQAGDRGTNQCRRFKSCRVSKQISASNSRPMRSSSPPGHFSADLLHVGQQSRPGGRMADTSSGLSDSLRQLGFEVGRFKTGTPAESVAVRLISHRCEKQLGDEPPPRFSFLPPSAARTRRDFHA